ncbi:hypothetical protein GOP47_0005673 [Adiantum capillus-veneris]|uniref:SBP-type domain-containing protein n=1 Tax=Adiantum capillus-veneris TaxID=13818 RepID=A0A9D4ZKZ9_ADICA|nr:hypothetical protein GOP47_0005002 [Adiantum capillus-veneris]KAI5080194.1 hypothetical protein GOP47_0005673 [Adiantum capillus-veneris]
MNSLSNLNTVVDDQGDSTPWPSDQGWDPPVATICTGSLSDTRLHFHHSAPPRQEWDWSDNQMILGPHYVTQDDDLDCKPGILHADTMLGGAGLGLKQYTAGLNVSAATSMVPPSVGGSGGGGAVLQTASWPGLLNAVPLRQHAGIESSAGGSCYSSSPLMYGGGLGGHAGSNNIGLGGYYNNTHQNQVLDMEQRRIHDMILKRGIYSGAGDLGSARLGLNLGGRTYFSTEDMAARFHLSGAGKRFRPNSPSMHVPLCQAEGCKADLSIAKHYHRRHKVCEYHSKASTVMITGNTQRFCQQCSRFHALTEFDEGKRSCRKRLADHNRRRRKPQPAAALPAADSASPTTQGTTSSTDAAASTKQNEDQLQDSKSGTALVSRSQSDQKGDQQSKEGMTGNKTASNSSTEQQTSLLSPMTLAPSVSLTLQNGGGRSTEMQSISITNMAVGSQGNSTEKEAAYINDRQSLAPYLLNGPSLSLSSNNVSSAGVRHVGGPDSVPSTAHPSPAHAANAPPTFDTEVELSVPWLRGHHVGSSPRVGIVQESLGKLSTCHEQADEGSMMYKSSINTANCRRNSNGQYFNEHGRILAERMQSLQSKVQNPLVQDHQQSIKRENWMLEGAVAHESQTVLSLLETGTSNAGRTKNAHEYNLQIDAATSMNAVDHQHHHFRECHRSAGGRHHPLDFLQQNNHPHHGGLHLNSASPADHMDNEASDAALSLHCMQVLRPLNESLYTTADFMKDSFV